MQIRNPFPPLLILLALLLAPLQATAYTNVLGGYSSSESCEGDDPYFITLGKGIYTAILSIECRKYLLTLDNHSVDEATCRVTRNGALMGTRTAKKGEKLNDVYIGQVGNGGDIVLDCDAKDTPEELECCRIETRERNGQDQIRLIIKKDVHGAVCSITQNGRTLAEVDSDYPGPGDKTSWVEPAEGTYNWGCK